MRARLPNVHSIAAHRGFADALVAGLIPRYREDGFGLARLTLLLPSHRALRTVTEAFVRASGGALILPRLVAIGDLDQGEGPGTLLDPILAGADLPTSVDPALRLLRITRLLGEELADADGADAAPGPAALLRQARAVVDTIDRLAIEDIAPERLLDPATIGLVGDLSRHWIDNTRIFARVLIRWQAECAERGVLDPPERRNRMLDAVAARWRAAPPPHPLVAAGITSSAPAVARLLRTIADLPEGAVVLPDLDLGLADEVWDSLGRAGAPGDGDGSVFGRDDVLTHPQYHLKLLLNRMGLSRAEVQPWHRAGPAAAPPARARAISSLFLPPEASAGWAAMPAEQRRLGNVRLMESAHPGEEAQAIAVLVREALATPERRVAVITPDRALAARLVAHLVRWNIVADDSAGRPLSHCAAGRLWLHLAECWADHAAPVPLLALLGHPQVRTGPERGRWLERVRQLDLVLRGPRPAPGLDALATLVAAHEARFPGLAAFWEEASALIAPLLAIDRPLPLGDAIERMAEVAEGLCGPAIWGSADGRALSAWVEQWREAAFAPGGAIDLPPAEAPALFAEALVEIAVRPAWSGHPRLAIYGLLEARMTRADLVICAGLIEGAWPGASGPDPLLAPPVLRALGVPGADFRIGLAAHDLAAALGAPEVVLSHARRDASGPAIASRFILRIHAMLGEQVTLETTAVAIAAAIDRPDRVQPAARPEPMPGASQRRVDIAATALDRLRGDPYQFYAASILRLSRLDPIDSEPTPAWRGTAVHAILESWHKAGAKPGQLVPLAVSALGEMSAHPFMRALWQPRLVAALEWIDEALTQQRREGREVVAFEQWGEMKVDGVRIKGRADRIDRLVDGTIAVVDYKTGGPPSTKMVKDGFALQLGLIGLIAEAGGFAGVAGTAGAFEYWSLKRRPGGDTGFGFMATPILIDGKRSGIELDEFLPKTLEYLRDAIARWILGNEPFTARLNPDLPGYSDYDQLMRLDEWQGRAPARAQTPSGEHE